MVGVIGGEARGQSGALWSATWVVGRPAPGAFTQGYSATLAYGSLSPASFAVTGTTYYVNYLIQNVNPNTDRRGDVCLNLSTTPPGPGQTHSARLPGDATTSYKLALTTQAGLVGEGLLVRKAYGDGTTPYCVRTADLTEGQAYTVSLFVGGPPEVRVEPVQTRTPAGEDAGFRVIVTPFAPRLLNVRTETVVRRPGQGIVRSGWVNIPRGATQASHTVSTESDTEQVSLEVRPASGYRVAASPNHRAVVQVGETADVSTVQVRTIKDTITEGETAVFVVAAEPAPATDLTVTLNVPRAPAANHEDEDDGRFGTGKPFVIPAGRSGRRLEFRTADDDVGEESGYIQVTLDPNGGPGWKIDNPNPPAGARFASARVNILDDDRVVLAVAASSESITEGETATFTVTSSTPPGSAPFDGNVEVDLTIAADGEAPPQTRPQLQTGDFGVTANTASLQIARGQTQVSHSVPTTGDDVAETNGSITATVSCSITHRCVIGTRSGSTGIRDDEPEIRVQPTLTGEAAKPFGSEPVLREGDPRITDAGTTELSFALSKSHPSPPLVYPKTKLCLDGGFRLGFPFENVGSGPRCEQDSGTSVRDDGGTFSTMALVDDSFYQPKPGRLTLEILETPGGNYHVPADPKHRIATWIIENDDPPELPVHEWNFWVNNHLPNAPPVCWSAYPGAAKYNAYVTDQHNRQVADKDITGRCIRPGGTNILVVTALDGEGRAITQPSNPVCTSDDETSVGPCESPPAPWFNPNFRVDDTTDPPQIVWDPYPGAEAYRLEFRRPTLTRDPYAAPAAPMDNAADEYTVRARAELGGDAVTAWTKWFHTCRPPKVTVDGDLTALSRDPHPGRRDAGDGGNPGGNTGSQGWIDPNFRVNATTDPPRVEWDSYPNASGYTVELTRPISWIGREDGGYLQMSNPGPGYTLRVKAHFADGAETEWTDWFSTCRPPAVHSGGPSDPPSCTTPSASQSWAPNFSVNAGTTPPQIEWAGYPGATGYTVEFTAPINWTGRKDGGFAEMSTDGPYYRMRAMAHAAGGDTPWSEWFQTCKPPHTATASPPTSDAECSTGATGTAGWDPEFSVNGNTSPPRIEWAAYPDATGYTVEFTAPINWTGRKDNGYAEMSSAGPEYTMRAKAHRDNGETSWTDWFNTCRPPYVHQGGPEAAPDCVDPTAAPPTASAGADVTAKRGEENVELLGTAGGTALTYQWRVVNASHPSLLELFVPEPVPARVPRTCEAERVWTETGPEAAWIGDADQATACFTVPRRRDVADTTSLDDGQWFELELQVTDTNGATANDRMRLTIEGTTWTADGEAAASSAPSSHWTRDDFEYWDTDANRDLTCAEAISRDEGLRLPAHRDNRDGTAGIYEWLERVTSSDHDGDGVSCEGSPNPDGYVPMTVVPALPFPAILIGLAAMWLAYRRAAHRA